MNRQIWLKSLKPNKVVYLTSLIDNSYKKVKIITITKHYIKLSNDEYVCTIDGENAHRTHTITPIEKS